MMSDQDEKLKITRLAVIKVLSLKLDGEGKCEVQWEN